MMAMRAAAGGTMRGPRGGVYHLGPRGQRISGPAPEPKGKAGGKPALAAKGKAGGKPAETDPVLDKKSGVTVSQVKAAFTPKGFDSVVERVKPSDKHGYSEIGIGLYKNGKRVGEINREFDNEDGVLLAHHSFFRLDKELRGKGASKEILRNSLDLYEKMGVKKITFQADSVGKYAWASLGFKEEEGRESLAPAFARHLRGLGLVKQAREVEEKNIAPRHIASFTIEGKSVGRSFLLSTDAPMWHAEMRVKRGDPDYEYLRDRVGAK